MIKAILEIISKVLSFFSGKNELEVKKLDLANTEEIKKVEMAKQEAELTDRAESLVREASNPNSDKKDEALEELRRFISR